MKSRFFRVRQELRRVLMPKSSPTYPADFSERKRKVCDFVHGYTMTSSERIGALVDAVEYVIRRDVPGAFVECGVWKGGSAMAMALSLKQLSAVDREIFLFDTFAGMPQPSEVDIAVDGASAMNIFSKRRVAPDSSNWCLSALDEVRANLAHTGYTMERIHFIEGKVEDTIPRHAPEKIAILRLDTDWYASTKHELEHLFPLLSDHGVLIIDDYGHWQGARKAVDEYFSEHNIRILLNRIDDTGRIALKT